MASCKDGKAVKFVVNGRKEVYKGPIDDERKLARVIRAAQWVAPGKSIIVEKHQGEEGIFENSIVGSPQETVER